MEKEKNVFPRAFTRILENTDVDNKWRKHIVEESIYDAFFPTYSTDDDVITVYLPREFVKMPHRVLRSCFAWLMGYTEHPDKIPAALHRYMNTPAYMSERRELILKDLRMRGRTLPKEFNEAMAINPGLRKCLDGMAFNYVPTDVDGTITRSDYISNVFLISEDVFKHPDRLLRVYVVYRELASAICTHPFKTSGLRPNQREMEKCMACFQNWEAYERRIAEMGWKFRYPMEL